ncbi:MAG TPA: Cas8a1 family CRISPR/Cas system-associated protein [Candidatus Atribacteria bacterium]|nr:Cas8a1 family CRISPR/Cas system-associated protein [Candidatus Atribacteria bacterium]
MSEIVLYPGNWLYNAGVVGLLRVLESANCEIERYLFKSGEVRLSGLENVISQKVDIEGIPISQLSLNWFRESWEILLSEDKKKNIDKNSDLPELIKGVWGTLFNAYYRGFFNADSNKIFTATKNDSRPTLQRFDEFVTEAILASYPSLMRCSFCNDHNVTFGYKNTFSSEHSKFLGSSASIKGMPNSFWNNDGQTGSLVCDRCSFILLCSHLSFISLSDGSEIFINAPSFEVMWYLNKYAREVYEKEKLKTTKEILGISLIEAVLKFHIQLGKWTMMNIEVVSKSGSTIDFFSLPYEIVLLLSDNNIASLLDDVGEFSVLNLVLDGNFRGILELAERIFKIALKPEKERGKQEKKFTNDKVRLKKNKENLISFSQKLFKLYALIEEKAKKEVYV